MSVVSLKEEVKDDLRIRDLMVRWEVWRDARRKEALAQLGYGPTMIAKCMDGMPSTKCPRCRGFGGTKGSDYSDCPICEGTGTVELDPSKLKDKINPAFIASTHRSSDDDSSAKIDRIMCQLRAKQKTLGYYLILLQEYTRIGTQQIKADRINLTWGAYKTKLSRAHRAIEERL